MSIDAPTTQLGNSGPEREPPPDFLAGWTRYDVIRRLGSGGMGEVFEAWDPNLERRVALKFLYGSDPEALERFTREAHSQARVDHPGICKVYEVGSVSGHPYIAMQEIDGVTLDEAARGLTIEQKVRLVRDVAEAIHAAHRLGLIHRDLKPGNILVERLDDGTLRPFVVDFGLARDQQSPSGYTLSGAIAGTVGYMSPEQARGRVELIDRRTDVYNLGVILYELLTGRMPFDTSDLVTALILLQSDDAPSPRKFAPSIPADLETIILKCLERDPARRYDSARAVAGELGRFLDGEPILARPASFLYRLRKRVVKHRAIAAVAAVATLLLAGSAAIVLWSRWEADRRAELAHRFGLQVKEMELVTRIANMLPPDRGMPVRRLIEPRMASVRREMAVHGKLARGPGHYALARGSLALGDLDAARRNIDLALEAGYDSAEVGYTRGEILGRAYQDALARAAQIADRDLREEAIRSARQRYRDPALASLRRARGGANVENPAYLEAQIAFFEERWSDAVAAARRASASTPWMYEAAMLEASILRTRAAGEGHRGDVERALGMLDEAGLVMARVLQVGRGDALAYVEECNRRSIRVRLVQFQRRIAPADVAEAAAPCRQALAIDAGVAAAWQVLARIHINAADDRARNGEDPEPFAVAALDAAGRALRIRPDFPEAHGARGGASFARARWAFNHGRDPRPFLETAVQSTGRAIALDSQSPELRNNIANVLVFRAYYEDRIGGDARPYLREAVRHYEQALKVVPNYALVYSNLGSAYVQLAESTFRTGGDARPLLEKAIESISHGARLMPSNASAFNNRGNALMSLAEYTLLGGGDPTPHVDRAVDDFQRAIELRREYPVPYFNIAYAQRIAAHHRMRHGINPASLIRSATTSLDRYDAFSPGDPDSALQRARLAMIEARYALRMGRDPRPHLAAVERYASAESNAAMRLALAERYRWEAEWLRGRGEDPAPAAQRGLAIVRSATRTPEAEALEGALLVAAGEEARGRARIDAALRANRNLCGEYPR